MPAPESHATLSHLSPHTAWIIQRFVSDTKQALKEQVVAEYLWGFPCERDSVATSPTMRLTFIKSAITKILRNCSDHHFAMFSKALIVIHKPVFPPKSAWHPELVEGCDLRRTTASFDKLRMLAVCITISAFADTL